MFYGWEVRVPGRVELASCMMRGHVGGHADPDDEVNVLRVELIIYTKFEDLQGNDHAEVIRQRAETGNEAKGNVAVVT